jgi:hypothetical protein
MRHVCVSADAARSRRAFARFPHGPPSSDPGSSQHELKQSNCLGGQLPEWQPRRSTHQLPEWIAEPPWKSNRIPLHYTRCKEGSNGPTRRRKRTHADNLGVQNASPHRDALSPIIPLTVHTWTPAWTLMGLPHNSSYCLIPPPPSRSLTSPSPPSSGTNPLIHSQY